MQVPTPLVIFACAVEIVAKATARVFLMSSNVTHTLTYTNTHMRSLTRTLVFICWALCAAKHFIISCLKCVKNLLSLACWNSFEAANANEAKPSMPRRGNLANLKVLPRPHSEQLNFKKPQRNLSIIIFNCKSRKNEKTKCENAAVQIMKGYPSLSLSVAFLLYFGSWALAAASSH